MKRVLLALALVGGLVAPALAQGVQNTLTGNETWQAGQGPGGPGAFITSGQVRGGTNVVTFTLAGALTIGAAATTAALAEGGNLLVLGTPAATAITFPANPVTHGAIIGICNGTAANFANTLTATANTGQSIVGTAALATLVAGTCGYFQFNRPNTTWYRVS